MKRKILITNDDGIAFDGLLRLVNVVKEYGEVWIVAPDGERSASSHCINLHDPIDIYPYDYSVDSINLIDSMNGVKAFSCSGTPADCVRVGSLAVMPEKPDIVFSGINKGYNAGTDIQYSGTCGAAFEASFQGIQAIAVSEGFGGQHIVTDTFLKEIIDQVIDRKLEFGQIWNINFPNCSLEECKGILWDRKVSRGLFYRDSYKVIQELDNGGKRYFVDGRRVEESEEGSDLRAIFDGYISVGVANNVS